MMTEPTNNAKIGEGAKGTNESVAPRYRIHIAREATTVEVRFEPLDGAPRLETIYVSPEDNVPYENGQEVEIEPEAHAELMLARTRRVEEERARQQAASMPEVSAITDLEKKEAAGQKETEKQIPLKPTPEPLKTDRSIRTERVIGDESAVKKPEE